MRTVKDKFRAMEHVHDQRGIRHRQKLDRLSAPVDQPMPTVQRRGKKAVGSPFKNPLGAPILPYLGRPMSVQNTDHLLVKMSLRLQGAAGRDLRHLHSRDSLHTIELNKSPPSS